jgi:hypothetical protein
MVGPVGEEDAHLAAFEALLRERRQRLADHEAGRTVLSEARADRVRQEIEVLRQGIAARRGRKRGADPARP